MAYVYVVSIVIASSVIVIIFIIRAIRHSEFMLFLFMSIMSQGVVAIVVILVSIVMVVVCVSFSRPAISSPLAPRVARSIASLSIQFAQIWYGSR